MSATQSTTLLKDYKNYIQHMYTTHVYNTKFKYLNGVADIEGVIINPKENRKLMKVGKSGRGARIVVCVPKAYIDKNVEVIVNFPDEQTPVRANWKSTKAITDIDRLIPDGYTVWSLYGNPDETLISRLFVSKEQPTGKVMSNVLIVCPEAKQ